MAKPSLDNPRAKLARATEHLDLLDKETRAFFAAEPYEVRAEFDPQTSEHIFRLHIRENPPLRLGTILGDFANNTRGGVPGFG